MQSPIGISTRRIKKQIRNMSIEKAIRRFIESKVARVKGNVEETLQLLSFIFFVFDLVFFFRFFFIFSHDGFVAINYTS